MKIEILKENLKKGLNITERIIGKNISLPILDNILITTEDSFLNLISTNLETTIKLWILTKIIKKGKVVIPAKFLSNYVSSLPNEKITIEEKSQNLYIECSNFKTQIQGYNPEEFPIIPEFSNLEYLEVDNKKFCQGLSQVIDIAMPSQSRPEISGIYFNFNKNNIKIVATDSFRLAEKNIVLESPVKKEYSFILPQRPSREIMSILEDKEGVLKIYFSGNQALFEFPMEEIKHPQVQIISRLIEGEYPNYQEIIPNKFKTNIVLKKDEFLNQIKTASLFSNKTNEVRLSVKPEKKEVEIFAKNTDIGENRSSVQAKIEGDAIEVSFNYRYLIEGLSNIKSSEVAFNISKEEGPCILKPVGDSSYVYVAMPIKSI
ncbi:MAG: polymerase III subunit beta protein [Parcubacteria group bacterium GW2011_GWA1_33_6]|uniref:Beta sliding clamp n=1 Tax=Candidatus Staskawiczbacteria bacterium RIFCSPHIGHO2_02_FULL_33_16 TaxID=1802204 RepID=A0A1G2HTF3_9BACT|nr:MAG: polymerase III subunit beta protein [Parcubacteria group bacterium GW2011_GWA2_33_14]KKP54750.1 MAG: polymerase III subunit beta protein [Parcubacteria group bacterium GW2011_GWA1_33_6]OGZ65767.1 MAG: DNA polymerase III subunit beta [Candidatus Staskawiczbacteria bacterium RIFCSPHIGHO2_02_FULL_33_16]OGZ70864.1 MAG: DNA polymerase III subunit beta [Candidatus Staskawiczbacteria bacterium RIFCSPLOWO2_01_FULL_33_13]